MTPGLAFGGEHEMVASRVCCLPYVGFLLGLFFDPENGADMFF
jgi:hypothetical protein